MGDEALNLLHLGVMLQEDLIAPPSQFALATIGNMSEREFRPLLEELLVYSAVGLIDVANTPMLEYYSKKLTGIKDLKEMSKIFYGSQKIIGRKAAMPINNKGQTTSLSVKNQANLRINSRRNKYSTDSTTMPHDVSITRIYNPEKIKFMGGTKFAQHQLERGNHWSEGSAQDEMYLMSLNIAQRAQFEISMSVIDYARAVSLIELDRLAKLKNPDLIAGSHLELSDKVVLPFDFSVKKIENPNDKFQAFKFAIEAYFQRYGFSEDIKSVLEVENSTLSLSDIDEMLLGKKGFVTEQTGKSLREGKISKGAILQNKSFSSPAYNWAIVQAIEKHYFSMGRDFKGYSLELSGSEKFRTSSIVFDTTSASDFKKDISMRIIIPKWAGGLPHILYMNYAPTREDYKKVVMTKEADVLANPSFALNIPSDVSKYTRAWSTVDWRTGKKALCVMRQPNDRILKQASHIARRIGHDYNMRQNYIKSFSQRTKK